MADDETILANRERRTPALDVADGDTASDENQPINSEGVQPLQEFILQEHNARLGKRPLLHNMEAKAIAEIANFLATMGRPSH
jgi:hypothetical protein